MALVTQPGQRARLLETSTYLDFFGVRNVSRQIVTPPVLSADVDNYPIQDGSRYGLSATVPVAITGLAAAQAWHGLDLDLVNVGSQVITLANLSASSLAPNRILTGTGSDLAIAPLATVSLFYDQSIPGWRVSTAPGGGGGGGPPVTDVQLFTTNGTWTKPAGAKRVEFRMIGSGGGGGSGRRGAVGTIRGGGGGGSAGSVTRVCRSAADLPASMDVTIPQGGAGGAAVTTDDTVGHDGSPAFSPEVYTTVVGGGLTFRARCGTGGQGGQAGPSANGGNITFGLSTFDPTSGPSRGSGSGADGPDLGSAEPIVGGHGGGGAGRNASNTQIGPGSGGNAGGAAEGGGAGGPAGNIFTAPPGLNGADGSDAVGAGSGGGGAGGGGATAGTTGGHGGKGGKYGAGGGGGEGVTNGNLSGAGGDGGPGFVEIVTYF